MGTPAMARPGAGGPMMGQAQGGAQQPTTDPRQVISEFRQLAEQIQSMAQRYPEFQAEAAKMLPLLQTAMARIVGNPNRVPPRQAPPVGA